MQRVGKHAWGTPKCGISLLDNTWSMISTDQDYEFVLARNPYNRVVSLYAEKVVDVNGNLRRQYNIPEDDVIGRERASERQLRNYCPIDTVSPVRDLSFKNFCLNLSQRFVHGGDQHVRKQCDGAPERKFDDVLWVSDLPDCFNIPVEKLGITLDTSKESLEKKGSHPTGPCHFTPRLDELNSLENPWDITVQQWWDLGAFPSNYDVLYNDEIRDTVYNLYRDDFEFFGLEK